MGKSDSASKVAIAIHGGSGIITRSEMTAEREAAIREALETSVRAGHRALLDGASSLEAVRAAVNVMEDSPLFNAGHGAVFNADEQHELDASVMDGATLEAGAVAAVRHIANPIDLALNVMSASDCGFNRSMQHLISKCREEDVADEEVSTKDLLQRSRQGADVGALAEG
jgi:beta-aspartyl-peptidase (threonine type)